MMHSKKICIGLLILGLTMPLMAKSKDKKPKMDPAMEKAMKMGAPTENHKVLEPFVGKWNASSKGWMKPGDKAQESTGTSDISWTMGGRFLKQEFKGEWAGTPFEGLGYFGYDNTRAEYQSIWL